MIRKLHNRERLDLLGNDDRGSGRPWGRYIYLLILTAFILGLANYLAGSSVFLRADGLVLRDVFTIAPSYEGKIVRLQVEPGQFVRKGDVLAQLESSSLARSLAELSFRQAEVTSRTEQLKSKLQTAETMLPLARSQLTEMERSVESMDLMKRRRLTSHQRVEALVTSHYSASAQLADLEAQKASLGREIAANEAARDEAVAAYEDLKRLYNDGLLLAPEDGMIGPEVASTGEVLVPGDKVLDLFAGAPYVFAYIPDSYLFEVRPDQLITVSGGRQNALGRIVEILPVAKNLPAEFQNLFQPRERSQIMRIELAQDVPFPVGQKVRVRTCAFANCRPAWSVLTAVGIRLHHSATEMLRPLSREFARIGEQVRLWLRTG